MSDGNEISLPPFFYVSPASRRVPTDFMMHLSTLEHHSDVNKAPENTAEDKVKRTRIKLLPKVTSCTLQSTTFIYRTLKFKVAYNN